MKSLIKHTLFILVLVAAGYYYWTTRPITHGPGEVAPSAPSHNSSFGLNEINHLNYTIKPLAEFNLVARVLSKQKYYYDRASEIAPYDFVVGWGPMSDERNLDHILIKQSDRDFSWEFTKPPIPIHEMRKYSTNMHIVPSSYEINEKLAAVRMGHVIEMKGYLVQLESPDGWKMQSPVPKRNSSLGGDDAKVVWVEEFRIHPR